MSDKILKQGDIIKISFNPKAWHEQVGRRSALVVSCGLYNNAVNLVVLCPIINTQNAFPFHVQLDKRTKTTGSVMCEQIKATDIHERGYTFVEKIPKDLLRCVLNIVQQEFNLDETDEPKNSELPR